MPAAVGGAADRRAGPGVVERGVSARAGETTRMSGDRALGGMVTMSRSSSGGTGAGCEWLGGVRATPLGPGRGAGGATEAGTAVVGGARGLAEMGVSLHQRNVRAQKKRALVRIAGEQPTSLAVEW